jgi:benzodiazapine receptor
MRGTSLLTTTVSVASTAALGGLATRPATQSVWYRELSKPRYQPPRWVFPVIWPALYADIALVSSSALDRLRDSADKSASRVYWRALIFNLSLNAGWSWLFFHRRALAAAVVANVALTASSADMARRAINVRGRPALPLVIYPLWCAFATLLSSHIWLLNRRRPN